MSAELQVQPAGNFIPAPQNFEEAWKIARLLSDSDLVPKDYRGKPANCLVALQWGADLGLPGLQALQNIAVIGGRPSVWGDAALALVQSHRAYLSHREWIEGVGDERVACCAITRKGMQEHVSRFSVGDAKRAGLWTKDGPWKQYPERMLKMRARGFALRDTFADALRGLSIGEESMDLPEKDMGPADVVDRTPAPAPAAPAALPAYPAERFEANKHMWAKVIAEGKRTADEIIITVETKGALTQQQKDEIRGFSVVAAPAPAEPEGEALDEGAQEFVGDMGDEE
jgi:hypothetical protein